MLGFDWKKAALFAANPFLAAQALAAKKGVDFAKKKIKQAIDRRVEQGVSKRMRQQAANDEDVTPAPPDVPPDEAPVDEDIANEGY